MVRWCRHSERVRNFMELIGQDYQLDSTSLLPKKVYLQQQQLLEALPDSSTPEPPAHQLKSILNTQKLFKQPPEEALWQQQSGDLLAQPN